MTEIEYSRSSEATALCKACGLCCTGHLFSWVRLKATELTPLEELGLNVIRNDPRQRGFTQPCPMWNGDCSIYHSPNYPRSCDSYKCKLLRELLDESVSLPKALRVVKQTMEKIRVVEEFLPSIANDSFRERLVAHLEQENTGMEFQRESKELLDMYESRFGVNDLVDKLEMV